MSSTIQDEPSPGRVTAQISDALARLLAVHTGHGATSARTTLGEDLIVCVLESVLSRGEQSLVRHGRDETVLRMRADYRDTMEVDAVRVVEEISGRNVKARMGANHIDPDLAVEIFVLEPEQSSSNGARAAPPDIADGI